MQVERWSLRLRMFLFFAFLAGSTIAVIGLGLGLGYKKLGDPEALNGFIFAGIIGGFGVLAVSVWIWMLFDEHVAKPIGELSGALLASAQTDIDSLPAKTSARYLGDLGLAAQTAGNQLLSTRKALAQTVAHETAQLIDTNEKLAALAAEVPFGILLLSNTHRVAFYNGAARALCSGDQELGLEHSLFDVLEEAAILSAYGRLCAGDGGIGHVISTTVSLQNGTHFLSARMRLVHAPRQYGDQPPYVLTLDEPPQDQHHQARRIDVGARAVQQFFDIGATAQTVNSVRHHLGAPQTSALQDALDAALMQAASAASSLFTEFNSLGTGSAQLLQVTGQDICDAITARLKEVDITLSATISTPVSIQVDPDTLIALITYIAQQLSRDGAKALSLLITPEDTGVMIALGWTGEVLYVDRLEAWLMETNNFGHSQTKGRACLNEMQTDIWPEAGIGSRRVLKLPIPNAHVRANPVTGGATYDFDLLTKQPNDTLGTTALKDLSYVVFDTETTGLLPDAGDEICQVAAIRIVNGKVVLGEQLDVLVDPKRSIPAAASKIHHITDDMVAGQPTIDIVGRALHSFARGAVLVAHNAPFDMAFLHRHAAKIGAEFNNPVIDTVLLSAVVFGQSQSHTLDDICVRLGVTIPPEQRHTALGDTVATAKVFLKMLHMAEAKGLTTFEGLLSEMKRHKRLLQDLNTTTSAD
ncbi:MAG: DNA polymerase-3 subunit epsilon [Celeribacter sp.]|jgi:DNA polymerase-3 subunit epsilon